MILPKKHLSFYESLFGYGSFLLSKISNPLTIDSLWMIYQESFRINEYPVKFTFDQFIITIDYLFLIGAIMLDERGRIAVETTQIVS